MKTSLLALAILLISMTVSSAFAQSARVGDLRTVRAAGSNGRIPFVREGIENSSVDFANEMGWASKATIKFDRTVLASERAPGTILRTRACRLTNVDSQQLMLESIAAGSDYFVDDFAITTSMNSITRSTQPVLTMELKSPYAVPSHLRLECVIWPIEVASGQSISREQRVDGENLLRVIPLDLLESATGGMISFTR